MIIHFVSLNTKWIDEMRALFNSNEDVAKISCIDIRKVPKKDTVFVSPANCLGFMDGGIDAVLSKMFPGVQRQVQNKIRSIGFRTCSGRPYLPIGSALIVPFPDIESAVVCAPTMYQPCDVSDTQNAYSSFLAALLLCNNAKPQTKTLVVTSHCCGFGQMTECESAKQMRKAYDDFMSGAYEQPTFASDNSFVLMSQPPESGI